MLVLIAEIEETGGMKQELNQVVRDQKHQAQSLEAAHNKQEINNQLILRNQEISNHYPENRGKRRHMTTDATSSNKGTEMRGAGYRNTLKPFASNLK